MTANDGLLATQHIALPPIESLLRASLAEDPAPLLRDGGVIAAGLYTEIDGLRDRACPTV